MTNIPSITTTVAKTGATAQGASAPGVAAGMFGGIGGLNFMDLIFNKQIAAQDGTDSVLKTPVTVHPSFSANTPVLTTAAGINTGDAALIAPDMMADGLSLDEINALLATLTAAPEQSGEAAAGLVTSDSPPVPLTGKQKQEVLKILTSLLQGLPAQNQPQIFINKNDGTTAAIAADGTISDPALIATPLTPVLLTEIIENLQNGGEAATLISGLVNIVTPVNGKTIKASTTDETAIGALDKATIKKTETAQGTILSLGLLGEDPDPGLAARMNALTPGAAGTPGTDLPTDTSGLKIGPQPATPSVPAGSEYIGNAAVNGKTGQSPASAGGSSFTGASSATMDSLLNSAGWDSIYPDGLEWTQATGTHTPTGLNLTGPASFASLVTQAQNATAPHPATQIVAATLTKAAAEGETKSMTLKLDPPELGRLEIRMDFAKEKGMKAHIVIEKHETYMMMQRDAHVLERALQDAGLSADGGGLSFELAQDGGLFDDGHQGSNRHGGGGSGSDTSADETIIETTMNWSVDAATGMTHYNLLV